MFYICCFYDTDITGYGGQSFKKATFYCEGLNLSHQLKQDLGDKAKM